MYPQELRRLIGAGAQLFQQRRFAEATRVFRRATDLAPGSVAAWCNLVAALVESREPVKALAAADRAIALDPNFAPAHANRGDALRLAKFPLEQCRDAYRRAVELQPRSPNLLNKLGATLQAMAEFDAAGRLFARALELAPDHRLARLNYGCMLVLQGNADLARRLALEGAMLRGVREPERREYADAVSILDRNGELDPVLRQAVANRSPEHFIATAVATPSAALAYDGQVVERIGRCLRKWSHSAPQPTLARTAPDDVDDLLEAHSSAYADEDPAGVRDTMERLRQHSGCCPDDKLRDVSDYLEAIRCHRSRGDQSFRDCRSVVAWLRYWHAFLTSHRQEAGPGQLKAFPNSVITNPDVERTVPGQVESTLNCICANLYAPLAPGMLRAITVYWAIIDVHPFADGNGRLGRFLINRELAAAGQGPVVMPQRLKPMFGRALQAMRFDADLQPFIDWLVACDEYTRKIKAALRAG